MISDEPEARFPNISEEEFQVLDALPVLISFVDTDQLYRYNNRAYEAHHKIPRSEMRGRHLREILGESAYETVRPFVEKALSGEEAVFEGYLTPKFPGRRYVNVTMIPSIADGKVRGFFVTVQDLTDRKLQEEEFRASEEEFRTIFELSSAGKVELDYESGRFLRINRKLCRLTGYSEDELMSMTLDRLMSETDYKEVERLINISLNGDEKEWLVESRIIRRDGSSIWVCTDGAFIYRDGRPHRIITSFHDINDLKESERKLKDAYEEIRELKEKLEAENIYLKKQLEEGYDFGRIIGKSSALKYVLFRIEKVAKSDTTVLLLGETGTGKGLIARTIHELSDRRNMPFVTVNCAALPANLIESELFGRAKGAFTGATDHQIGRFELASGGTLFLDEIGEMPIELQSKLLRVIETGEFEKLGNARTIRTDVRLIASTNRNLEDEIIAGRFRKDLFYRLNVFPVTLPSLYQRREDIIEIAMFFLQKFNVKYGKRITDINPAAQTRMLEYSWPGNVRELQNVIERAVILGGEEHLLIGDEFFPEKIHRAEVPVAAEAKFSSDLLEEVQRQHILRTLLQTKWRIEGKSGAAALLGIKPSTLRARMKKLNISRPI